MPAPTSAGSRLHRDLF